MTSISSVDVKRANRRLYDAVAGQYESLDGRRDDSLTQWIRAKLEVAATNHGRKVLLDLGAGSGFITRAADALFRHTIALDLSPRILEAAGRIAKHRIAADTDWLPLADASVNVVTCFAVLHHLYDTSRLAGEVARVLKPGGLFWSDHDLDSDFYRRFQVPLCVYRRLRGADRKYIRASSDIDAMTYALAEFRENGVESARVERDFREAGLTPTATFHWYGLGRLTNRLFGTKPRSQGRAPILSIAARKPTLSEIEHWPRSS